MASKTPSNGRNRAVIRNVYPEIEGGQFAIKRVIGEAVDVWADVLADGHDIVSCSIQFRHESQKTWKEHAGVSIGSDRWHFSFTPDREGNYVYRLAAWVDAALTWQYGITKKIDAGIDVSLEFKEGIQVLAAIQKPSAEELNLLDQCIAAFTSGSDTANNLAKSEHLIDLLHKHPNRPYTTYSPLEYRLVVDREKAAFSTWYEFFPRSSAQHGHGTFKDCINLLPRIAELGFDTLYFPPVHPIGRINRKGKNNATVALKDDVGSCWGIGANEGGHQSILPELGNLADFKALAEAAQEYNIELAMDYALQATPDHPWVKEHPEWFKQRPDGSIQYAENPPKKYQDIYPINFESEDWENMWQHFRDVLLFWIDHGVKVFRVDNPHTKAFGFWEWVIANIKQKHPDVLFLSEAFSRPQVMYELARVGFTQSYTYFTWRNSKAELIEYMLELNSGPLREYFRPNFWPNTPDILPFALQNAEAPTYVVRYFLAATLSSNCGVYGPVYELLVNQAMPGKEEYADSEKYQVSHWDWEERNAVTEVYRIANSARQAYKALQRTNNIEFLTIDHDQLLAYIKRGADGQNLLCIANLDPNHTSAGQLHLHPDQLDRTWDEGIRLTDLKNDQSFHWKGDRHHIELAPESPYHLFKID